MGFSQEGSIKRWWPDETATAFWIVGDAQMGDILDRAKAKWGDDLDLNKIKIESRYEHTDCLTYDLYDPSDYTEFLLISYTK